MNRELKRLAVVLIVLVVAVGGATALINGVNTDGVITIDGGDDGPLVEVTTTNEDLNLINPVDGDTVTVQTSDSQAQFSSPGRTESAVDSNDLEGAFTTVTAIDATESELRIDPLDKVAVTVEGSLDSISFRNVTVDSPETDFSYSASSSVRIQVLAQDLDGETIIAVDEATGTVLDQATVDGAEVDFTNLDAGSYDVQLSTTSDPVLSNGQPDGEELSDLESQLSIDVEDADFGEPHGDEVTVTFYDGDDEPIGTDTLTEDGTASVVWNDLVGGPNEWYAIATDAYGGETTSDTFVINAASTIEIRDESNPDEIVTGDGEATVTFFGSDEVFERVAEDGVVDMQGLPANQEFIITIEMDGFVTRQAIIPSISEQSEVYILPDSADAVDIRFRLLDPTGLFSEEDSRLFVERPITRNNQTIFRTVAADDFGANGYGVRLKQDQRYRLRAVSESGQERLFTFTSQTDEAVELEVSQIEFEFEGEGNYAWNAQLVGNESIRFDYSDSEALTESLELTITNRTSNEVIYQSELQGSEIMDMHTLATQAGPQDAFIVEWTATRDDQEISGSTVVGQSQVPVNLPGLSDRHQNIIGSFALILIAGAFGRSNAAAGGIIVSLVAGFLWFIGWMPGAVSGLFIAAALALSIVYRMAFSGGLR